MTRDMTQGSPLKLLLSFMVPIFIGNLFQNLYSIVDSIIVGRYLGVNALAAVGSVGIVAVSYTHLDVYKRQAQNRGNEEGSAGIERCRTAPDETVLQYGRFD